jgi:hypothetical protein
MPSSTPESVPKLCHQKRWRVSSAAGIVLGQIYQCQRKPDLALSHYREALGLAEAAGEPQILFPCYEGLATLYLEMKQW